MGKLINSMNCPYSPDIHRTMLAWADGKLEVACIVVASVFVGNYVIVVVLKLDSCNACCFYTICLHTVCFHTAYLHTVCLHTGCFSIVLLFLPSILIPRRSYTCLVVTLFVLFLVSVFP